MAENAKDEVPATKATEEVPLKKRTSVPDEATDESVNTEKVVENEVSDEVTDEVCANIEYEAKIQESKESEIYQFECWDPRNKWEIQDVFNHMGETLEQMFQVFKVNSEDQQYQLDVDEKINESFKVKLEMKKFKNLKAVRPS